MSVVTEIKRAQQHGFTAPEYIRAREEYLSQLEKQYNERNKVSNERYGRSYAANYLGNDPIPSIEEEYTIMQQLVPNIPVEVINQILPQIVSGTDKNVVVLSLHPEKEGAVYPTVEGLTAAVTEARNAEVEPYVDNVKNEPLIGTLPQAGAIESEKYNEAFGYSELTLSNGAKVILKQTDFKENEILMNAESRGGGSLYGKEDWANVAMFDFALMSSGLGEFDNTELEKALAGKQASASWALSTSYERLSGKSTVKDLETMFQLAYLQFTDVRKDEKCFNTTMNQLETALKNKNARPEAVFSDSVNVTINNHSWRDLPFEAEHLKDVNYDRIMEIAKERSANAADFTFYFVGNFDNDSIRKYICQYIASLPGDKGASENYLNVTERPTKDVVNQFSRKMETPKANVRMYWYIFADAPYSEEASVKTNIVGKLLSKVYLKRIREEESAAYSASAAGATQLIGDKNYTYIVGVCPVKPEKFDIGVNIMREELEKMTTTVDEGSLKEIQELLVKDYVKNCKENNYWNGVLSMYVERGLDTHTGYQAIVESQTTETIKAYVKEFLGKCCHVEVMMTPEE